MLPRSLTPERDRRLALPGALPEDRPGPLAVVGVLCAAMACLWVLTVEPGQASGDLPLLAVAALAVLLTVLDPRVGLGLLIFSIGISPEFELGGVSNLRLEDFLFPFLFGSWLFRLIARRESLASTELKGPILATLVISLLSSIYNSLYGDLDLASCAFRLGKSLEYFLIFTMALNILRQPQDLRAFVYLMPAVGALVGVYGIFQSTGPQVRVTGPHGETSNILGGYYVLHICLAIGLIACTGRWRLRLAAAAALMVVPLLQTMSRTSYVALLAGLASMFAMRRNAMTALVLGGSLVGIVCSSRLSERFLTILDSLRGNAPSSLVMRVRGWGEFLEWVPQAPLLGVGVGNKPLGAYDSEYIRQVFELGVPGLCIFLWMAVLILRTCLRVARDAEDPVFRGFGLGLGGGTAAFLVHSLAAATFTTIRTSEPFFFAAGILCSISLRVPGRKTEELPAELPWALPSTGSRPSSPGSRTAPGALSTARQKSVT